MISCCENVQDVFLGDETVVQVEDSANDDEAVFDFGLEELGCCYSEGFFDGSRRAMLDYFGLVGFNTALVFPNFVDPRELSVTGL